MDTQIQMIYKCTRFYRQDMQIMCSGAIQRSILTAVLDIREFHAQSSTPSFRLQGFDSRDLNRLFSRYSLSELFVITLLPYCCNVSVLCSFFWSYGVPWFLSSSFTLSTFGARKPLIVYTLLFSTRRKFLTDCHTTCTPSPRTGLL
jgi:hypothetical protein